MTQPITFFSVCSGIEAATVAWSPLGWKCIGVAEIEKFPSALLAHRYPDVPNHGDFTKIKTHRLGRVDVLCGGTPCQAFSVAGARNSLSDARGNLTLAFVDLAHDLAENNDLRNVVWENVPGVLSTKDNAFGCFLAGLIGADDPLVPVQSKPAAGKSNRWWGWSKKEGSHYIKWPRSGMVAGPKGRAAWTVKDAQYFGLAQRRERVVLVADFGNGADPAAVLFEPEGVRRDSPPSRETGERIAPTISARPTGGGGLGTDFDLDGGLVHAPQIARGDATREGSSLDYETTTMLAVGVTDRASHALKAEGADASEDGTGRGTPIVAFDARQTDVLVYGDKTGPLDTKFPGPAICFSAKDYGADAQRDLSPTLRAGGHSTSHANAGVMPAVAYSVALRGREEGGTAELGDDVAFALRASGGGGDKPHVMTETPVAFTCSSQANSYAWERDVYPTLNAQIPNDTSNIQYGIRYGSAVRRLTPRECERLQGFQFRVDPTYPQAWQDDAGRWWSPDYTAIPWRGKPADQCPDGPRYKALGNSWAVPKFRWLGERIQMLMPVAIPPCPVPMPVPPCPVKLPCAATS